MGATDRGARCAKGRSIGTHRHGSRCLPNCGAKLTIRKRLSGDQCLPDRREEALGAVIPAFRAAGPAKIAAMRAAGHDPTTTREAQRRRAASASKQRKAVAAWRDDGSLDGADFRRDVPPKLQGFPVRMIAEAMGASISHGSKVRAGVVRLVRM